MHDSYHCSRYNTQTKRLTVAMFQALIGHIAGELEDEAMPYVHVRIAGELTRDQKAKIAAEFTQTLARVANKPPSYTYVTIEEVKLENWAVAGELLDGGG